MGKKKRGGKKNKAGRGGSGGGGKPAGVAQKASTKDKEPAKFVAHAGVVVEDEQAVSGDDIGAGTAAAIEESNAETVVTVDENAVIAEQDNVKAAKSPAEGEGGVGEVVNHNNGVLEDIDDETKNAHSKSEGGAEGDSNKDVVKSSVHDELLEAVVEKGVDAGGVVSTAAKDELQTESDTAVEDVAAEEKAEESKDLHSTDAKIDTSEYCAPMEDPMRDTAATSVNGSVGAEEENEESEVERADTITKQVENHEESQSKVDTIPIPSPGKDACTTGDNDIEISESFSSVDGGSPQRMALKSFPSRLSSQEMEEVDLDASDPKTASPIPLVKEYNGTPNGLSPATHNSLSFFKDSTESEAFVFLTAALRETLGDDANGVTDETLCRYLRWKPDVARAAERFGAYQSFRKDNTYIYDDKPLILSQDPKLLFLIKTGFVMAPDELLAKDGSGVMIIKGSRCDLTLCDDHDASRAIFFILQRIMERHTRDPLKGITIILDLAGATRKNNPRKLAALLSKAAGCVPVRVKAIFVVSMPWWFPAASSRKLFSLKLRPRIHVLKDKVAALSDFVEKDRLLEEYGGIYNFDLQTWVASTVLNEVEGGGCQ